MALPSSITLSFPSDRSTKSGPVKLTVPGSKSITNRVLILAVLGRGEKILRGALWSEDTEVMVHALQKLGFVVEVSEPDPLEPCNRTIRVIGTGGIIPNSGSPENPLGLYVANAGTAARFLAALVCLGHGSYRLHGVPRMHERPQAALLQALRQLGYQVISENQNDRLPALISSKGPCPTLTECEVSMEKSSQFASALLLCAGIGNWKVSVKGQNIEESPYVAMTQDLILKFTRAAGDFLIEPDASSGSYFWALGHLMDSEVKPQDSQFPVQVVDWPKTRWQIDSNFVHHLPLPDKISRATDLGDSIMTAIVLAAFTNRRIEFQNLGRLRLQECDRVLALHDELTRCGVRVGMDSAGETLWVMPGGKFQPAEIETYNDHRMAMCFAVAAFKIPGLVIRNPSCVKKTFPNFFQKLGAPFPTGLGVEIRNAVTGKTLFGQDLFAEQ
jgi:3-phosphoshikimate 1-carboxyvinyltransferase